MTELNVKGDKMTDVKDIFDYTSAGDSKPLMQESKNWYTKVIKGIKRVPHAIIMMPPEKFAVVYAVTDVLNEKIRNKVDLANLKAKYSLPYIDTIRGKAKGRGRALLCLKAGITEIPVLVVAKTQEEADNYYKKPAIKKMAKNIVPEKVVKKGKKVKKDK